MSEKKEQKQVRIIDIARKAKVSIGTVDRVLYNRGGVKPSTKEKILKIIQELDYSPNMLAKSLALKKKYKVVVFMPDGAHNAYWQKPYKGISQAVSDLMNFNFEVDVVTFDLSDENSFLHQAEKVIRIHPAGVVFVPVFKKSAFDFCHELERQDIPYSFMDIYLQGAGQIAFFGQDAEKSGRVAGKLMCHGLTSGSVVGIVSITDKMPISRNIINRVNGFKSFFVSEDKTVRFEEVVIDLSLNRDLNHFFQMLIKKNIHGIFVPNSRAHLVAEFLTHEKVNSNILLVGYDLIEQNVRFLKNGGISFLISQKPEQQIYNAIKSLFDYILLDKKDRKINYSPIDILIKENIEFYKK